MDFTASKRTFLPFLSFSPILLWDMDWSNAETPSFPKLKPSTQTISLRLPEPLLDDLKRLANKRDVPYQSLLKTFLADRIEAEMHPAKG